MSPRSVISTLSNEKNSGVQSNQKRTVLNFDSNTRKEIEFLDYINDRFKKRNQRNV